MLIGRILKNRQTGSSLIEVLVTMVIVALGLLGQAALVAQSSKSSNAALMHSQATLLAYDILERLRLNRSLAIAGSFTTKFDTPPPSGGAATSIQGIELVGWLTNVAQMLPNGQGQISVDGNGNATIDIRWNEVANGALTGAVTQTTFSTQSVI
jgi:type IV pilus assembly protein PilV